MKLGFVCRFDPENEKEFRRALSGIIWHMLKEFEAQGVEIEYFGPITGGFMAEIAAKAIRGINKLFRLKRPLRPECNPFILGKMAKEVEKRVRNSQVDAILAQDLTRMAYVNLDIPIFYWRDANFMDLYKTYKGYKKTHPISIKWAHEQERRAMNSATITFFSSECSYETATSFLNGIPLSKVKVIPMGANHSYHLNREDINRFIARRPRDLCHLLFFGVDWKRKGGDIAVEICRILNQRGTRTKLDIVGSDFEINPEIMPYVNKHGFVKKYTSEGAEKLRNLLENTHFLVHPATAEAYGCVLPEACSFGIPCITNSVGGLPTIVKNGKNGFVFPVGTPAASYADCIEEIFHDYNRYMQLAKTAFEEYEQRLNWRVAVSRAKDLIEEAISVRQEKNSPSLK